MHRQFLKFVLIVLLACAVLTGGFSLWVSDKHVAPIMMYHSVNYSQEYNNNIISPEKFAWHMEFLHENDYKVISLDELVDSIVGKKQISRKSIVITFDDGYQDNYTYAFPILRKYGFPATIFASTITIEDEGYLTWEQIKGMEQYGIFTESHTITQAYLPGVSSREKRRQILKSKKVLEKNLGHEISYISYPSGGFSREIKKLVKEAGYKGACATNRGYDRLNKDVYELNRIRFSENDNSRWILWSKFSGFYNTFRGLKSPD